MAAASAPAGINSAMLASMENHSNAGHSVGIGGAGAVGIGGSIGGEGWINEQLKKEIPSIGDASVDSAFLSSLGGAINQDPLSVFDGNFFSPGNINAFQGMDSLQGSGNMALSNVGAGTQLNAPSGPTGLFGKSEQGQGH